MSNLVKIRDLTQKGIPELTDALEISQDEPRESRFISAGSLSALFQLTSEKNAANGYAGLDGSSNLDVNQIPNLIPATSIADGSVNNTEFQFLNTVTSNIQTQLNATEKTANKGVASGYAALDSSLELLLANFPGGSALQVLRRNSANDELEFVTATSFAITALNSDTTSVQTLSGGTGITISDTTGDHSFAIDSSVVTLNDSQTLTNKTLTTPAIGNFSSSEHDHEDGTGGGQLDSTDALSDTDDIAYLNTANSFGVGLKQSFQASSGVAGININDQLPSSVVAGDIFRDDDELQYGDATPATQTIVTTSLTQTLTNKTLTQPTIGNFTSATHNHQAAAGGNQLLSTSALSDTANIAYLNTANTYSTGLQNFNAVSMRIPSSNTPTISVEGDFAIDTSVDDFSYGLIQYRDDSEILGVVSMPIAQFTTPEDKDTISYNTSTNVFELIQPTAQEFFGPWTNTHDAGGQILNNLGVLTSNATNPATTGTIRLGNTEGIVWRNAANNADGLTFDFTAADVAKLSVLTRSYEFSEDILTLDGADLRNVGSLGIGSAADPAPNELVVDASAGDNNAGFVMIGSNGNVTQRIGSEFDWVYRRTSGTAIMDIISIPEDNTNAVFRFGLFNGALGNTNLQLFDSNSNKIQSQLGSSNGQVTFFNRFGSNTAIGKNQANFQLDVNGDIRTTDNFIIDSGGVKATGTITIDSPVANTFATGTATLLNVAVGETVTINGLTYTAISGTKVDNITFDIDGNDTQDATDLTDSINNDTRTGTLGDVSAISSAGEVTITTDVLGIDGNAITLAESGSGITVSGTTLGTGTGTPGVNADTVTLYNNLLYTAVNGIKTDNTEFQVNIGTDTATAGSLVDSINGDSRQAQGASGGIVNTIASSVAELVTLTASRTGNAGNNILLASSSASTLLTSGTKLGSVISGVNADQLTIASGGLDGANKIVSFPDIIDDDTFVLEDTSQILINKTITAAANTLDIALDDLSDVTIDSVSDTEILIFDSISSVFENHALSGNVTISNLGVATVNTGIIQKTDCLVASTVNIASLSLEQTIDGVTTNLSRVLVKNQSDESENGIYLTNPAAWARATDADSTDELSNGIFTDISSGDTQTGTRWVLVSPNRIVVDTDDILFEQFSGLASINGDTITDQIIEGTTNLITVGTSAGTTTINVGSNVARTQAANSWGEFDQNIQTTGKWQEGGVDISPIGLHNKWESAFVMWAENSNAPSGPALLDLGDIMVQVLEFDSNTDEFAQFTWTIPKEWDAQTVTVEFFWTATSGSGDVVWGASGASVANDDPLSISFGDAQTVTDTLTLANDLMIATTSAITISGTPTAGDMVQFRIFRAATDGDDTFSTDAELIGVRINYTTDAAVAT